MKCIVIYFSQTGNTEKVAKAIQKGIKRAAGHCDITTLKEANWRNLYKYDLIGLGCPLYQYAEPPNIQAFIKNMRFVGGKHAFVFATHGTRGEFFFPSIVPKLKKRGLVVVGMYDCYGDAFLSPHHPYATAGHPDEIDLKEAEDFGKETVARSRRIAAGETGFIPSYPEYAEYDLKKWFEDKEARIKELSMPIGKGKMEFAFNKEKCTYPGCRLCMDNCPMDGIDLSVKPPVIAKPCMACQFCVAICPTGAIALKASPGGPSSGFSPDAAITIFKEFYLAPLDRAEAEGRFRRLIPAEEIGLAPNIPDKHPRWVIGKGLQ
jgi:flavodoxin/ferredoxin